MIEHDRASSKRANRSTSLAACRGVAMIIVVLFHADLVLGDQIRSYATFGTTALALQYFALPMFFLSMGLSVARVDRPGASLKPLSVSILTYAYLYVVWTCIGFVAAALSFRMNVAPPASAFGLVKSVLFPSGPLWFLPASAFMAVLYVVVSRQNRPTKLVAALVVAALPHLPHVTGGFATLTARNVPCFFIGLMFRDELLALIDRIGSRTLAVGAAVVPAAIALLIAAGIESWMPVYTAMGTAAFALCCSAFDRSPWAGPVAGLARIGRSALPIYLLHDGWNHLAALIVQKSGWPLPMSGASSAAVPGAMTAVSIALCLLLRGPLYRSGFLLSAPARLQARLGALLFPALDSIVLPRVAWPGGAGRGAPVR